MGGDSTQKYQPRARKQLRVPRWPDTIQRVNLAGHVDRWRPNVITDTLKGFKLWIEGSETTVLSAPKLFLAGGNLQGVEQDSQCRIVQPGR